VSGPEAPDLVSAMLLAAAIRAGAGELRVFLAGEVRLDARPPKGMDLPAFETTPTDGLPELLAQEAHARAMPGPREGWGPEKFEEPRGRRGGFATPGDSL